MQLVAFFNSVAKETTLDEKVVDWQTLVIIISVAHLSFAPLYMYVL